MDEKRQMSYIQRNGVVARELRLRDDLHGDLLASATVDCLLDHTVGPASERGLHLVHAVDVCSHGTSVGLHARVVVI